MEVEKMSTIQETKFQPAPLKAGGYERADGENRPNAGSRFSSQGGLSAAGDLVLPLDGKTDFEGALEHSIKLAKTYGARIVLLYVTSERAVPEEYAAYAKVERIRDFGSSYYSSLGASTIASLRHRVEGEGVECTGHVFLGSLEDAIRASQRDSRVLMLVLTLPKKSSRLKIGKASLRMSALSGLGVPVVLVPAS